MVANPGAAAVLRVRRYTHPWGNLLLKEVAVRTKKRKRKEIFLQPHSLRKCHKYAIQYFHIIALDTQLNTVKY